MAKVRLPHTLTGLFHRLGHDDAVRNARVELDLAASRVAAADELMQRVEARVSDAAAKPRRRPPTRRAA